MLLEIILGFIILLLLLRMNKKPDKLPPGHWGIPLFGSLPRPSTIEKDIFALVRKYNSKLVSWRIGSQIFVFISDYKLTKDLFNKIEVANRPEFRMINLVQIKGTTVGGVSATNGMQWHGARRFALRHLRDQGMGKSRMVRSVQIEAQYLVNDIKALNESPTVPPRSLSVSVFNIIWQMVASQRFDIGDPKLHEFELLIKSFLGNTTPIFIPDVFTWVRTLFPGKIFDKIFKIEHLQELSDKLVEFITEFIEDHKKTLDENNPRDFIDDYIIDMKNKDVEENNNKSVSDLIYTIGDFFFAGSEGVFQFVSWGLLYLANYKEIQNKMYDEIKDVLGDEMAIWDDRHSMPYTEAFFNELQRHVSQVSLGTFRMNSQEIEVNGYVIPKKSVIIPLLTYIHYDATYWKNPSVFDPERFLDTAGKFCPPKDAFMPFGSGKRICIGESLARMEFFIFLVTLLQNFEIVPASGSVLDLRPDPNISFAHLSVPQNIIFKIRKS